MAAGVAAAADLPVVAPREVGDMAVAPEIPAWAKKILKPEDFERIAEAVRKAELRTCAEIVPMIVRGSTPTGHVPWLVFLILFLSFWILLPYVFEFVPVGPAWLWEFGALVLAALLAWFLSKFDIVARCLTSAADEAMSVDRRALLEFHLSRIKETRDGTGVLIFVSLLEHRAVVLADKKISEKCPPETWERVLIELIAQVKKGDLAGGMCKAIEELGEILAREFPHYEGDHNELADRLIVKD